MIIRRIFSLRQSIESRIPKITERIYERLQLPEKWKGGRIEKWSNFWQGLFLDYKTAATEAIQDVKMKPKKAIAICSGIGTMVAAFKTNPDDQSFYASLINCTTTLSVVSDPIRNPIAEQHIQFLLRCRNQGLLRKSDLLFFTFMWVADYDKDCNIYASQCKYLKPDFLSFYERIVDVGIFGVWWNMKLKMRDFDINPNEWVERRDVDL